jgi:hypothetical protein
LFIFVSCFGKARLQYSYIVENLMREVKGQRVSEVWQRCSQAAAELLLFTKTVVSGKILEPVTKVAFEEKVRNFEGIDFNKF